MIRQESHSLTGQATPDPVLAPSSRPQPARRSCCCPAPAAASCTLPTWRSGSARTRHAHPAGVGPAGNWAENPGEAIPQSMAIAAHYVDVLRRAFPDAGRYYLIGHSFGTLIGLEMARHLYVAQPPGGASLVTLCVFDNPAPQPTAIPDYAGYDHGNWLVHVATRIGKLNEQALQLRRSELDGLTIAGQNALLVDRLIRQGLLPAGVSATYFSRFIDVYRADPHGGGVFTAHRRSAPLNLLLVRAQAGDADLGTRPSPAAGTGGPDLGLAGIYHRRGAHRDHTGYTLEHLCAASRGEPGCGAG